MKALSLALIVVFTPWTLAAQDRRWEIEGYAGGLAQAASAGSVTIPPPGAALVTSTPTFPARAISSWLFGDGAALLNGVLAEFGRWSRITPLDPAFAPLPSTHPAAFGVRVRRRLNARASLEFSVDALAGSPIRNNGALKDAVDATRASFTPAFRDLFTSGP